MNKTDKAKIVKKIKEVRDEVGSTLRKELGFVADILFKKSQELAGTKEEKEGKTLSEKALAVKAQVQRLGSSGEREAMAAAFSTLLGEEITVDNDKDDDGEGLITGIVVVLEDEESGEQPVLITSDGNYGVYWKNDNDGQTPFLTQISFSMGEKYRLATKEEVLELVVCMEVDTVEAWLDEEYERIYDELAA